jgi:hypothetical protein
MSDTPKFEVIDRRKMKAQEEQENQQHAEPVAVPASEPSSGPRLVVTEPKAAPETEAAPEAAEEQAHELPPGPSAEESSEQKKAYEAASQRLEEIIRAQNPAMGPQPAIGFEHLVQQFYVSGMIQMGAGGQEGQRPRVDILGARTTIDLLGVLEEKTRGNLTEIESRTLKGVLFELRMMFMELTSMISLQAMQPGAPPPPTGRR